ncbi:MAG TPA: flippase [Candidatus Paceibacterota bacterium]|nr:flippase [Candidatus Paceibacterota bacterium]
MDQPTHEPPPPVSKKARILSFLFNNKNAKQTIAKNTFWLSVSNFGGKAIRAVIIIYAARVLGAAEYGVFTYAITLAGFISLVMDPGINFVFMRDAARASDEDQRSIFGTAFGIKLVLLAIGASIILFAGPLFSTLPGAKILLPIAAIIAVFDTLRDFFLSLMRAREQMEWDAGITLVTNLAIVTVGFALLFLSPSAKSLIWGYALGSVIGTTIVMIALRSYIRTAFAKFRRRLAKPMVAAAWPFAITGALGLLLTNADILIISWFRSAEVVGIYAAGIRIIQALYLIPGILQTSTLPLLARLANSDNEKFRGTLERIVSTLFLAAIPLAAGGIVVGTQLIGTIFGAAFIPGAPSFKILMLTMMIDFPGSVIGTAVFAYGHQKSLIITSATAGILNVALDLALIPHFGMAGSALATLIAQGASNAYLWVIMNRINPFSVANRLRNVLIATAIMTVLAEALTLLHVEVFVTIACCVAAYFAMLATFREPLLREVTSRFQTRNPLS